MNIFHKEWLHFDFITILFVAIGLFLQAQLSAAEDVSSYTQVAMETHHGPMVCNCQLVKTRGFIASMLYILK